MMGRRLGRCRKGGAPDKPYSPSRKPLFMDYLSTSLVVGGYLLTLLLVPYAFFQQRKQPGSILAWIVAIVALPYLGGLLFLLVGINRVERRAALRVASRQQMGRVVPGLARFQLLPGEALEPQV